MRPRLLPLVGLALLARPVAAGRPPHLTVGPLSLDAGLSVVARPLAPVAPQPQPQPRPARNGWRQDGAALILEIGGPGYLGTLRAEPGADGIALVAEVRYTTAVEIDQEVIQLRLPGRARALGRDLAVQPLEGPLRVDRGTPIFAATGRRGTTGAAVIGGEGVHAARYVPQGHDTEIELVLDDAGTHPFSAFVRCRTRYIPRDLAREPGAPPPRRPPPELERRAQHARITRAAGDVVRARATLIPIPAGGRFLPLIPERWPSGTRAALVFTDHADRTDPLALRAILYGVSDPRDPTYRRGGFLGHGLRLTKSFFASPGIGSLEDPDASALADELAAAGSEVSAHSITPGRDSRTEVVGGLARFSRWHPATWIDHQPDTNCEAITSRGWGDDARFGIHDLLAAGGFQWVWGARDVSNRVGLQNLFAPGQRAAAMPPIYPLPSDPRLWVFTSTWFYGRVEEVARALSEPALAALERERGLFIAHTYLSASPRTTRRRDLLRRGLVVPRTGGGFAIHPLLEQALAVVGRRVARGDMASLTLVEAAERLRALDQVVIGYQASGRVVIQNRGPRAVRGLTVTVPDEVTLTALTGRLLGARLAPGRTTVWFDLPAGQSVTLAGSRDGRQVTLGATP